MVAQKAVQGHEGGGGTHAAQGRDNLPAQAVAPQQVLDGPGLRLGLQLALQQALQRLHGLGVLAALEHGQGLGRQAGVLQRLVQPLQGFGRGDEAQALEQGRGLAALFQQGVQQGGHGQGVLQTGKGRVRRLPNGDVVALAELQQRAHGLARADAAQGLDGGAALFVAAVAGLARQGVDSVVLLQRLQVGKRKGHLASPLCPSGLPY